MVMTIVATFLCETISYIFQIILFKLSIEILPFMKIIIIEIVFNSLLIIILYPIIKKTGLILEKVFTEDRILTRYY